MRQQARNLVHARRDIDGLEDFLLFLRLYVHDGDSQIGKCRWLIDRLDRSKQLTRDLGKQLDRFDRLRFEVDEARFDFGGENPRLRDAQHARHQERPAAQIFDDLKTLLALADQVMRTIGRRDVAHDVGDRTHAVHVDRARIGNFAVALQKDSDLTLFPHRLLRGTDRLRPAERNGQHLPRKQHRVAHRHDDQRVRWQNRQSRSGLRTRFCLNLFSHDSSPLSPA